MHFRRAGVVIYQPIKYTTLARLEWVATPARGNQKNIVVGAILYGSPESLQIGKHFNKK